MRPIHVTIAGAGLVGSLLAVMLNQRGYRVTIYEKRPDMRQLDISAGRSINLALAQRGINALRMAGLMDEVEPLLIPMRGRMLHEINSAPEFFPYGQFEHEVIYSVSRGELNRIMMTAAEQESLTEIVFQQGIQSLDLSQNLLTLDDAQTAQTQTVNYEFLIGADGGGSRVRGAIMDASGGEFMADMLDHDYKELEIPAAENGTHRIEKEALHIWPRGGYMLIALPNLDGSFTVTLFLPSQGPESFEKLTDAEAVQSFFDRRFPAAVEHLPDLVEDFFSNPTGELGTIRCYPWAVQNAMLIGDSAHAIVPFHGQGMNCGFEDCAKFMAILEQHGDDWNTAVPAFQEMRKPNTDAIADMALENYVIMRDSVADPEFQKKKEVGFELERRFPNQFIPRYSMVMFHDIPYAEAFKRGKIQDEILTSWVRSDSASQRQALEQRIQSELPPLEFAF